ncbi:MAG: hypothetical protein K2X91_10135, partial [Thermoleophilia bacterium]|nr:hypothetical protein [Thermoleophilia bacterium]
WGDLLWSAWAEAAARSREPAWSAALLRRWTKTTNWAVASVLVKALDPEHRDALILELGGPDADLLAPSGRAFPLVQLVEGPIGRPLAVALLRAIETVAAKKKTTPQSYAIWSLVERLGRLVPPDLRGELPPDLVELAEGDGYWSHAVKTLIETLDDRREMHEEFAR